MILALLRMSAKEEREAVRRNHRDMMMLITSLGHNGPKYRREATKRIRAIVAEVYSAPRVAAIARRVGRLGIIPGLAFDLTTHDSSGQPWDFNNSDQREKAERLLDEQQPLLLMGSPMCTAFSNIQNLNKAKRDPAVVQQEFEKARIHLKWCCHLYQKQVDGGAYVLHGHPAYASSWKTPEIEYILSRAASHHS